MTDTITPAEQKSSPISVLAKLATFFQKSVSDADLKDIEEIVSVVSDHVEPHVMPTRQEIDTGPGQAMRGGAAPTEVARHSNLLPQQGLSEMYEKFDAMMGQLQKAFTDYQAKTGKDIKSLSGVVKGIADSFAEITKAAEKEKDDLDKSRAEKDSAEEVAAKAAAVKKAAKDAIALAVSTAFRKAKLALRKAEDMDEEEEDDKAENMEKANDALAALNVAVSKAEEDAEDDEEDKMAEKARQDLRTLKASLKKIVAKKAAKTVQTEARVVLTKDDIQTAMNEWAASKGVPVSEVFAAFGQRVDPLREPPTFAKAYADKAVLTPTEVARRIEDAADSDLLKDSEILKAESLKARLGLVQSGKYDAENFYHELGLASTAVQSIFTLPKAA